MDYKKALMIALFFALSSCVPYKEAAFLQDGNGGGEAFKQKEFVYVLRPSDQLYVKINTLDKELNEFLGGGGGGGQMQQGGGGGGASLLSPQLYLQSYVIDSDSTVNLPFIGRVVVGNKTLEEASREIQKAVDAKLVGTTINVKMVSYKVTIHGEVGAQGVVTVFSNEANIFEVLGLAGGITEFGDRKNIQVIRHVDGGTELYKIDLTKKSLFTSDAYQLLPNDIVVVNPLRAKSQRLNLPLISVVVSAVTSVLVILNFARN